MRRICSAEVAADVEAQLFAHHGKSAEGLYRQGARTLRHNLSDEVEPVERIKVDRFFRAAY